MAEPRTWAFSAGVDPDRFADQIVRAASTCGLVARVLDAATIPVGSRVLRYAVRTAAGPVAVIAMDLDTDGSANPELLRALSAESGGFVVAAEMIDTRTRYGLWTFFAGITVESWAYDPERGASGSADLPEGGLAGAVSSGLRTLHSELVDVGLDLGFANDEPHALVLTGSAPRPTSSDREEPHDGVTRAVFAPVRPEVFDAATRELVADTESGPWARASRETPTSIPYGVLQGPGRLDDLPVFAIARQCSSPALAVEVRPNGEGYTWFEVAEDGSPERGTDSGAMSLARRWRTFAVGIGEGGGFPVAP